MGFFTDLRTVRTQVDAARKSQQATGTSVDEDPDLETGLPVTVDDAADPREPSSQDRR